MKDIYDLMVEVARRRGDHQVTMSTVVQSKWTHLLMVDARRSRLKMRAYVEVSIRAHSLVPDGPRIALEVLYAHYPSALAKMHKQDFEAVARTTEYTLGEDDEQLLDEILTFLTHAVAPTHCTDYKGGSMKLVDVEELK